MMLARLPKHNCLEPLADWFVNLPRRDVCPVSKITELFNVLRSFDVNYSGADADTMVGGVLGGSISGSGSNCTGEFLEIRPGSWIRKADSPAFKVCPLKFKCETIMTEKTTLPKASAGGLIALRTTLCSSLCSNDRLVGYVVGLPGTLPPVWGPTLRLDSLRFVKVDPLTISKKFRAEKVL
jgi:translation initiation factor 2 subunit 3